MDKQEHSRKVNQDQTNVSEEEGLIKELAKQKQEGMDYSAIRKQLVDKGFETSYIAEIIRKVDELVLKDNQDIRISKKFKDAKIIGYIFMFAGGLVTLASYMQMIDLKGKSFLAWAPLVIGYYIIFKSRLASRKQIK